MRLLTPALLLILLGTTAIAQDSEASHADDEAHQDHAEGEANDEDEDHLAELSGLRLLHAWTNATTDDHAHLYLTIENDGEEAFLTGASTEIAAEAHIVAQPMDAGGEPEEIGTLPLPAGSDMALEPGGVFIELHGLTEALVEGGAFEVVLTFDPLGDVEVHVQVEAEDARQHSHAGHNH